MLKITNLTAEVDEYAVLEDINIEVKAGEIHAILGPKESGKSALAHVLMGYEGYNVPKGKINFKRKIITETPTEQRAKLGMFMAFQNPPEIPGLNNLELTKSLIKKHDKETDVIDDYKKFISKLDLGSDWINKQNNLGASNIEKKKNEILQMLMLDPDFIIIDDIDLNTEADALQDIASNISSFLSKKNKGCIILTNQAAILEMIKPTHVHVMIDGKIVESGTGRILKRVLKDGYRKFSETK